MSFTIKDHSKSKRVQVITLQESDLDKLIFPFKKHSITSLEYKPFSRFSLAKSLDEVKERVSQILGMQLITHQTGPEGKKVNKVLISEDVYYPGDSEPKEYYLSILLDRAKACNVIMASTEGGMDIEEVAEHSPEKIIKEWIDPRVGLQDFQARKVAFALGLS